jgi:integrase
LKRRETPLKRTNPSGETVWVARYTNLEGKRKSAGTYPLKRKAQDAIDEAYEEMESASGGPAGVSGGMTLGEYKELWPDRHPRPPQTADSYKSRLKAAVAIPVYGRPLGAWPYRDLRRHHMVTAFDHMLRKEGRSQKGAIGLRNALSAMTEDAITDEVAEVNFAKGAQVRANDPRIRKPPKRKRIWTFDQMREFAAAGRAEIRRQTPKPEPDRKTGETLYYAPINYEPMLATFGLANLRIGEVFALLQTELDREKHMLYPTGNAYKGVIARGDTVEKKHEGEIPIPPSLAVLLETLPPRIDTQLLFPTPKGTCWHDSTFRRDVWKPAQIASGLPILPHECRHSYVTHLRAAGVDPADLAAVTRHDIDTATRHYTQPLGQSMEQIREIIG